MDGENEFLLLRFCKIFFKKIMAYVEYPDNLNAIILQKILDSVNGYI